MKVDAAFDVRAAQDREAVESRLAELVALFAGEHAGMRAAVEYSLLGGGKRLRPLLCLWTHDAFAGTQRDAALDAACAVECVHTYSLVHDDLPCMDDDDLRRGRPSSHRKFGEATAVLTGDALLTLGFQILSALDARHRVGTECALALTGMLARAAGTGGLITGQAIDLAPPVQRDAAAVLLIHENKTARMIAASMEMGALLAGADAVTRERVRRAGIDAGCAFQIVDDLLDLEGTPESLGKTPGKDVDVGKLTYPAVVGAARAREEAGRRIAGARAGLADLAGTPLDSLIRFLGERSS